MKKNDLIKRRKKEMKEFKKGDICPICKWAFSSCQCRFSGSAHPDRNLQRKVVLDHLYLLTKKQLKHLIQLEKDCCISSSDENYNKILKDLQGE